MVSCFYNTLDFIGFILCNSIPNYSALFYISVSFNIASVEHFQGRHSKTLVKKKFIFYHDVSDNNLYTFSGYI